MNIEEKQDMFRLILDVNGDTSFGTTSGLSEHDMGVVWILDPHRGARLRSATDRRGWGRARRTSGNQSRHRRYLGVFLHWMLSQGADRAVPGAS